MSDDPPDLVIAVLEDLRTQSSVIAITNRIYRTDDIPKIPTPPYVVVSDVSDAAGTQFMADARIQCSCFAKKDREASALSKTIRGLWHRRKNTLLPAGSRRVWIIGAKDGGNQPDSNPEIPLYTHHRDILINYDYR